MTAAGICCANAAPRVRIGVPFVRQRHRFAVVVAHVDVGAQQHSGIAHETRQPPDRLGEVRLGEPAVALGIAADLYRYGRNVLRQRHTWLLSVPLVAAAAGFAQRGVRALWHPESVATEMIADSALNTTSAADRLFTSQPGISASDVAKTMKIKPNYLYRVLGELEKEGRVKKKGREYHPA